MTVQTDVVGVGTDALIAVLPEPGSTNQNVYADPYNATLS